MHLSIGTFHGMSLHGFCWRDRHNAVQQYIKMTQNREVERQPLDYYLALKYHMSIYPEEEGGYTVIIPDLPGCMTQGDTLEEAIENIDEARELWLETVYETGKKEIPFPSRRI